MNMWTPVVCRSISKRVISLEFNTAHRQKIHQMKAYFSLSIDIHHITELFI